MKGLLSLFLAFTIWPSSCFHKPLPPPTNLPSEGRLGSAVSNKDSKISANAEAADFASERIIDETVKGAVKGPISVIRSLSGPATDKDRADAMSLVVKALSGKLAESNTGWATARQEADAKIAEIATLKSSIEHEKQVARTEQERQLKEANDKANAERKKWVMLVTIGLGSLCLAASVAILFLASTYPLLGPKASFATAGAGVTLIGIGIAINAVERALEEHPWIVASGVGISVILLAIAGSLIYANHSHHKDSLVAQKNANN